MLKEFKQFISRGNVMDLAIAVIIGGAFGKIVTSLVNDILMPVIGLITAGKDVSDLGVVLKPAVIEGDTIISPEVVFAYGSFIQSVIDFLIIGFCIFIIIKFVNKTKSAFEKNKKTETPAPVEPSKEELLLTEIRDILKKSANS
ncbi:MAG: large-conductance mechanosensitive channel protein MscL [Bacillota bacterium]|jgi:large conductance mechanosensitive channel